ncbi:unnamed protein product [Lactuca virosa]|uniref:Uncharacterized protein n=1 Tax=Lactuca virosa TaxID=75947 RepID=A0AAU9M588_9ASTR|nr:unnamed protein product [Lactuca virosa]
MLLTKMTIDSIVSEFHPKPLLVPVGGFFGLKKGPLKLSGPGAHSEHEVGAIPRWQKVAVWRSSWQIFEVRLLLDFFSDLHL